MQRTILALSLLLTILCAQAHSASKQYVLPQSGITFKDSGGSAVLATNGVASGAGRYSDRYDKNPLASATGAMPANWLWNCQFSLTGTNVVGATIEIYASLSDGTNADGQLGTTNGTLVTDKRRNLKFLGVVSVDQTTTNTVMTGSGLAYLPLRYFSVAYWNATGLPLQSTNNVSLCTFYPIPNEMQ